MMLDRLVTQLLTSLGYGEGMRVFLEAVRDAHEAEREAIREKLHDDLAASLASIQAGKDGE